MDQKITLGYWGCRGRAQVLRLLLAYTDAVWQQVTYTAHQQWFQKDKIELGLPFPNLPYVIDGNFKLSQTQAIAFHIINRSNKKQLAGKNLNDASMIKNLLGVIFEGFQHIKALAFNKEWETAKEAAWQKSKPKFDLLHSFIGQKEFAMGYLTIVDFFMAQYSYYIQAVMPQVLKSHGEWLRARQKIQNLSQVKKYYQQPNCIKGPFLPPNMIHVKFPQK